MLPGRDPLFPRRWHTSLFCAIHARASSLTLQFGKSEKARRIFRLATSALSILGLQQTSINKIRQSIKGLLRLFTFTFLVLFHFLD